MEYNMDFATKESESKPTIVLINIKNMANRENTVESIQFASIRGVTAGRTTFYIQSLSIFYKELRLFIVHI